MLLRFLLGLVLVTLLHQNQVVQGANVLFIEGVPSPSHHVWNKAIFSFLAERGHNVTVLTVESEQPERNLRYIQMEGVYEALDKDWLPNHKVPFAKRSEFKTIKEMYEFHTFVGKLLPKTRGFQQLMDYPDAFNFHVIIHDFTGAQVLLGFVERFRNPPLISVSAFGMPPFVYAVAGTSLLPSYLPHYATDYVEDMSMLQRVKNAAIYLYDWYYRRFVYLKTQNSLLKQSFPESTKSVEELERNSAIVLLNTDPSLDYAVPLPPNVFQVAGVHTKIKDPLIPRLEIALNKASEGAILFSLGINLHSEAVTRDKAEIFLEAFRKAPHILFIWKYGGTLKNVPENVLIYDWIPQLSVLQHPNCKAFITNGGLLSLHEAAWHNKPVVGIPLFGDQFQNIAKVVNDGVGIQLDYHSLTTPIVEKAINEILREKYFDNMVIRSMRLGSNLAHPVEVATYFIDHVTFNGNALHLRSPIIDMPFWKLYFLDVFAVITLVIGGYAVVLVRHFGGCKEKPATKNVKEDKAESTKKVTKAPASGSKKEEKPKQKAPKATGKSKKTD